MVAVGKAVGFVADGLKEAEAWMVAGEFLFCVTVGPDDMLMTFGETDHHDVRHADFLEDLHADAELPRATIKNDKIRQWKVFTDETAIATRQYLLHEGCIIVGRLGTDAEAAVVAGGGASVLEADHGANCQNATYV